MAYPLIDSSTADAKTVEVERIALQNILSLDQTAYCLQIELSEQTDPFCLRNWNVTPLLQNTADLVSAIVLRNFYTTGFIYKLSNTDLKISRPY